MCFSANASFIAAGVLAAIGTASLYLNHKKSYRMLAATPLLFAIQQASEGIVWLTIAGPHDWIHKAAVYFFLTFAGIVWPLWSPISLLMLEQKAAKRLILFGFAGLGVFIASSTLWTFATMPITARIVSCSIDYQGTSPIEIPTFLLFGIYTLATVIPLFISSLRYGWLLGSVWLGSLFVALIIRYETTTSVWCFFAAILSVLILWVIKEERSAARHDNF